jgi:hypothetical protein
LQPDDCFAAAPDTSCVEGVAGNDEHVGAIAGNTAMSPNSAADGCGRPGIDIRRIIDGHANHPAVISAAIAQVSGPSDIDNTVNESEPAALVLHQ